MPQDESDPEDPLELRGVGLLTEHDTSEPMAECFIEEFLRLGYDARQILALFRNPHYLGVHLIFQARGEAFVRAKINEVFGWWQQPADFTTPRTASEVRSADAGPNAALGHPMEPPPIGPPGRAAQRIP
jgi:hypothetical protein